MPHQPAGVRHGTHARWLIVGYVIFTFIGYFNIGLSLAVLPVFITGSLGYNAVMAGLAISVQYVATLLFRGYSGKVVDSSGPKPAVQFSMFAFFVSGIVLAMAFAARDHAHLSLALIIVTRLLTGCAEGMVGASPINWAMLRVGSRHTATIIPYNGIASYGALAMGAPLGVYVIKLGNFYWLAAIIVISSVVGFVYVKTKRALDGSHNAARQSFVKVLAHVAPYGICLGLGGLGFGTISTFMTLYYAYRHWANGALALSLFGILFIAGRLFFSNSISRYGGLRVGIVCLLVEAMGLAIIWLWPSAAGSLIAAAIAGLGFSLVFPALGVEAIKASPPANQGAALAGYGVFIDISLGLTGPLVGFVAERFGMAAIFPFAMGVVLIGVAVGALVGRQKGG
ncbi:MAG: MFS transporter [Edaphocola sp.]